MSEQSMSNNDDYKNNEWNGVVERLFHICGKADSSTVDEVKGLLQKFPDAARASHHGNYLLHQACWGHAPVDLIVFLMEAWPDAVIQENYRGLFPLHVACKTVPRCMETIRLLVDRWPSALEIGVSFKNDLPLHLACRGPQVSFNVVRYLFRMYPRALRIPNHHGQYPLHKACERPTTDCQELLKVIEYLVDAWPESVEVACGKRADVDEGGCCDDDEDEDEDRDDEQGWMFYNYDNDEENLLRGACRVYNGLPMDLLCVWKPLEPYASQLIRLLTHGIPPLHFACTHARTSTIPVRLATLTHLSSLFPKQFLQFYNGMTPFHRACRSGSPRALLKWLLQHRPHAIRLATTDTGDLPLHCYLSSAVAARHFQPHISTARYLVASYCDALRCPNRRGLLPWHMAALHNAPLDVLFYLTQQLPECCEYRHKCSDACPCLRKQWILGNKNKKKRDICGIALTDYVNRSIEKIRA